MVELYELFVMHWTHFTTFCREFMFLDHYTSLQSHSSQPIKLFVPIEDFFKDHRSR